jgi:hypothetical protein
METENKNRPFSPNEKEGVVGPIIGSVIILLLILLGGIYYMKHIQDTRAQNELRKQQLDSMNQEEVTIIIREIIKQEEEIAQDNLVNDLEKELDELEKELDELDNM